jgi:hypothetical protein
MQANIATLDFMVVSDWFSDWRVVRVIRRELPRLRSISRRRNGLDDII